MIFEEFICHSYLGDEIHGTLLKKQVVKYNKQHALYIQMDLFLDTFLDIPQKMGTWSIQKIPIEKTGNQGIPLVEVSTPWHR